MGNSCASKKVPDLEFQIDGNTTSCFDKIRCKSSCCVVVETSQNSQTKVSGSLVVASENVEVSRVEASRSEVQSHKSKKKKKK